MMTEFNRDYLLDPGINIKQDPAVSIKQETMNSDVIMNTSASVPIPARRAMEMSDYRDFSIDLDNSQSPLYNQDLGGSFVQSPEMLDGSSMWGNRLMNTEDLIKTEALIHMDDDDIFQVDKSDLIQVGPTLAELNANDETLLGDLNFDDLLLPEESSYITLTQKFNPYSISNSNQLNNNQINVASSCPPQGIIFYKDLELSNSSSSNFAYNKNVPAFSPASQASPNSSILQLSPMHAGLMQPKHSTLHELLKKRDNYGSPDRILADHVQPSTSPNVHLPRTHLSRLSSSAPTHLGPDQIWQRREPRRHLLSTGSLVEAGSTSSLSTGGILSPDPQDLSHDEGDSDDDSDAHYEDFSSDNGGDSDFEDEHGTKSSPTNKKERYFWQYNVQAKGPKGQRLVMKCKMEDPHVLNEITDPVFSPDCSVRGIKHSGKARKGDGNDLTPNPKKLYAIGKELGKLSRIINDMTPVSELPFNVRPKSRKEKNKLASRACRLKKKAQHEANKIKLSGLEVEHKRLLNAIYQAKQVLATKITDPSMEKHEELAQHLEKLQKAAGKIKIAGHTTEYVNKILERVKGSNGTVTMDDL